MTPSKVCMTGENWFGGPNFNDYRALNSHVSQAYKWAAHRDAVLLSTRLCYR